MNIYNLDEDSKNTLELFVERTEALAQFTLENRFGGGLVGLFRNVDEEEWQIHSAINGCLCILRSFLQSQDGITLFSVEEAKNPKEVESRGPQLLKTLPDLLAQLGQLPSLKRPKLFDLNISTECREAVYSAYDQLYRFLAIMPDNLTYDDQPITRFEVLNTFLYGKFVHVKAEKRKKYNQWKSEPELYNKLKWVFINSLPFLIDQILKVAEASKKELDLYVQGTES